MPSCLVAHSVVSACCFFNRPIPSQRRRPGHRARRLTARADQAVHHLCLGRRRAARLRRRAIGVRAAVRARRLQAARATHVSAAVARGVSASHSRRRVLEAIGARLVYSPCRTPGIIDHSLCFDAKRQRHCLS